MAIGEWGRKNQWVMKVKAGTDRPRGAWSRRRGKKRVGEMFG